MQLHFHLKPNITRFPFYALCALTFAALPQNSPPETKRKSDCQLAI